MPDVAMFRVSYLQTRRLAAESPASRRWLPSRSAVPPQRVSLEPDTRQDGGGGRTSNHINGDGESRDREQSETLKTCPETRQWRADCFLTLPVAVDKRYDLVGVGRNEKYIEPNYVHVP